MIYTEKMQLALFYVAYFLFWFGKSKDATWVKNH